MRKNKLILLLCLALLTVLKTFSQENLFDRPRIFEIKYSRLDKKYGIRYYPPDKVVELLDSVVSSQALSGTKNSYILNMELMHDTTTLFLYRIKGSFDHLKNRDIRLLTKTTHRYMMINGMRSPIFFDSDIRFGFPNFSFLDYDVYIRFLGSKLESGKIIELDVR